jgi:hypothetical protein
MPTALAALLFAAPFASFHSTPVYGLQLQAPMLQSAAWFAPVDIVDVDPTLPLLGLAQAAEPASSGATFAAQVRQRQETGQIHRALGIATWAAMTVTVILGIIQYHNLYGGTGGSLDDNPCANGNAIFGQGQCWGTPWPHLISAAVTTALYTTTMSFSIGLLLNDPNEVLSGPGAYSDRIRAHSVLALIHLAGMLAQTFIGIGLANNWFGDRANDFSSMQTVAAVHQAIGFTTWAALGIAGGLMLF